MKIETLKNEPEYEFQRVDGAGRITLHSQKLTTFFLYEGEADLSIGRGKTTRQYNLLQGQALITTPGYNTVLTAKSPITAFQTTSRISEEPIMRVLDIGPEQDTREFEGYEIVRTLKTVKKPWGEEKWLNHTNYHVMKMIINKLEGNKSSLQVHLRKRESNYVAEGEIDFIGGYHIPENLLNKLEDSLSEKSDFVNVFEPSEEAVRAIVSYVEEDLGGKIEELAFDKYRKKMVKGECTTRIPGELHRVIVRKGPYIEIEASTGHLADVVRLTDKTKRRAGRIASEHN
jgi:hypothetical protein